MFDLQKYKSILCLNGELPEANFFQMDLPIIAADGAANQLMALGIKPEIVIGDLDSIKEEHKNELNTFLHYDQNYCDFQKALFYLEQQHLLPAIIVGLNGGLIDHVLNNINHFLSGDNVFYAPPVYGLVMNKPETREFTFTANTKISLFGIPSATVSTQGLKWELNHNVLNFPGPNSSLNVTVLDEVAINLHSGNLLVLIYLK